MSDHPIPSEVIAAQLKVQELVGKLGKADFNEHGNYRFVPIDAYYEKVARVAAAEGLTWIARCVGFEKISEKGCRFDYQFDLIHKDGSTVQSFFCHPVLHPIQGAQTAGSALSYADKLFMRHAFKVVTGEADADSTAPSSLDLDLPAKQPIDLDLPPKPMPAPVSAQPQTVAVQPLPRPGAEDSELTTAVQQVASGLKDGKPLLKVPDEHSQFDLIERVLTVFVDLCASKEELITYWSDNIEALDAMMKLDPERHARVKNVFVARKAQVETGNGR